MKGNTHASNGSSVDKEGKTEAAINQSIRKANYGDLLWVQLHGSSWWPAQVVDDSTVSAIHKSRERRKDEVLARLYGSYKYLFIDPISSCLEFEDTLNKYNGSHIAILEDSLKQLKFGTSKKKQVKMKGKVRADASQERMVKEKEKQKQKQKEISKTQSRKIPLSGRCSAGELDANCPAKKSKEATLGSVKTKEKNSQKRKKEEAHKKSKSNSTKSASRKEEQDMEHKKPKTNHAASPRTSAGRASSGATPKTSLKRHSSSAKSEQRNNKKKKQSDTQKNLSTDSPNSKLSRPQGSANQGHSLSRNMGSLKTKVQTQKTVQRKLGKSDAAKTSRANKDAGRKKNAKASKLEILSATLEEAAKEPSARQLKVMRFLGLIPPAGSPFIRNRSISSSAQLNA